MERDGTGRGEELWDMDICNLTKKWAVMKLHLRGRNLRKLEEVAEEQRVHRGGCRATRI